MVLRIGNIRIAILTICQLIGLFFRFAPLAVFLLLFNCQFLLNIDLLPTDLFAIAINSCFQ